MLAFVGRAVGEWFGIESSVRGVALDMRRPVFLGRTLTCEARRTVATDGGGAVVDFALRTEDGTCTVGAIEVDLPAG